MPTYDYICEACGHEFEEFQSMSAAPLKKCPSCKKSKLKRLIGIGAGVIFKGSGFYETDYRSDKYKAAAKADTEASTTKTEAPKSDAAKTDGGKSETPKPEAAKSDTGKTETAKPAASKPEPTKNSATKNDNSGKSSSGKGKSKH